MSWRKGWTGGIERYRNRRIECRAWKAWMLISCCASMRPPSDLLDESLSQDIVDDDAMVLDTATHQCGSASAKTVLAVSYYTVTHLQQDHRSCCPVKCSGCTRCYQDRTPSPRRRLQYTRPSLKAVALMSASSSLSMIQRTRIYIEPC